MGTGIENLKKQKRTRLIISVLKLLLLASIVIGVPLYIYLVHGNLLHRFEDVQAVIALLEQYEAESIPVYLGLQVLQIVISVLPGQVFQIAAGYMYPFWLALMLAMTGAVAGTCITFGLAKYLGRDFLRRHASAEQPNQQYRNQNQAHSSLVLHLKRSFRILLFLKLKLR